MRGPGTRPTPKPTSRLHEAPAPQGAFGKFCRYVRATFLIDDQPVASGRGADGMTAFAQLADVLDAQGITDGRVTAVPDYYDVHLTGGRSLTGSTPRASLDAWASHSTCIPAPSCIQVPSCVTPASMRRRALSRVHLCPRSRISAAGFFSTPSLPSRPAAGSGNQTRRFVSRDRPRRSWRRSGLGAARAVSQRHRGRT
jgi:hypothetical protein